MLQLQQAREELEIAREELDRFARRQSTRDVLQAGIDPDDYAARILPPGSLAQQAFSGDQAGGNRDSPSRLATREPQLRSAQAARERASANLEAAQLSLSRTRISAPFSSLVEEENAAVGTLVQPGQTLGTLVATEVKVLEQLTESTERPYAVVLGGSKVSDKLAVIENLATKADSLIIGGGMCFTFLAAQGLSVGSSLLEEGMVDTCRKLLDTYADVLHLPVDIVVAEKFAADSPPETVSCDAIPDDKMGLDIGPESVKRFAALLSNAKTVFWNGPMGVFEFPAFSAGTKGVAEAIIAATGKGGFSVVGGGDSAAAVRQLGLPDDGFSHISTGGGASLEYLEGKTLPGISVLES